MSDESNGFQKVFKVWCCDPFALKLHPIILRCESFSEKMLHAKLKMHTLW